MLYLKSIHHCGTDIKLKNPSNYKENYKTMHLVNCKFVQTNIKRCVKCKEFKVQ